MKKLNTNVIIGIVFIIAGIFLCLQVFHVDLRINMAIFWWGLLALAGIIVMINDKRPNVISSLMIVIGIWNVLKVCGLISVSIFHMIWPIVLIVIGINFLFSKNILTMVRTQREEQDGILVYNGIFSAVEEKLTVSDFKGLNANAIFGGIELDLTEVTVQQKQVILNLSAVFGGIDIRVSNKYNIVMGENVGVFGGTDTKYRSDYDDSKNTIYINSRAIFGGVDIK